MNAKASCLACRATPCLPLTQTQHSQAGSTLLHCKNNLVQRDGAFQQENNTPAPQTAVLPHTEWAVSWKRWSTSTNPGLDPSLCSLSLNNGSGQTMAFFSPLQWWREQWPLALHKGATNKDIWDIPSMKRMLNITSHCQLSVIFTDQTLLQNAMVRNKGFFLVKKQTGNRSNGCTTDL